MDRGGNQNQEGSMTNTYSFDAESSSAQTHLKIIQGVITRMAENSRACKIWCITIVSASLVLVARADRPNLVLISLVPTVAFLILDVYYLALERAFRESYDAFIEKLARGKLTPCDLYVVKPTGSVPRAFFRSLNSFSIWPFYAALVIAVLVVWCLI